MWFWRWVGFEVMGCRDGHEAHTVDRRNPANQLIWRICHHFSWGLISNRWLAGFLPSTVVVVYITTFWGFPIEGGMSLFPNKTATFDICKSSSS